MCDNNRHISCAAAGPEIVNDKGSPSSSIVELFDQLCFQYGDEDVIHVMDNLSSFPPQPATTSTPITSTMQSLCYFELQEYSKALAHQLLWRFRPTFVLVDCHGWPGAEVVALLACARLKVPFVPVSCRDQHAGPGRLATIVQQLLNSSTGADKPSVVAITCCENDQDPILGVFQKANVHSILFVDPSGNLREPLDVPAYLPEHTATSTSSNHNAAIRNDDDDLYVLFTSGTSGRHPKAVRGSHRSTLARLMVHWEYPLVGPTQSNEREPEQGPWRVAKRTPLTFVDSVVELLGTILAPNCVLVSVEPSIVGTPLDVGTLVTQTQCSQITLLPSQLSQLLLYKKQQSIHQQQPTTVPQWPFLKRIIISGEPCSVELWKAFQREFVNPLWDQHNNNSGKPHYTCQLVNLYGQTETTADCCGAVLTNLEEHQVVVRNVVTIGKPLRPPIQIFHHNNDNKNNNSNGVQASHELWVSGQDCLANGYLQCSGSSDGNNDDDAARGGFWDVPATMLAGTVATVDQQQTLPQSRAFATGDVGFCEDGFWYVQGRVDDVVKINGGWTSPSEVETAFLAYCNASSEREELEVDTVLPQQSETWQSVSGAAAAILDHRVLMLAELASANKGNKGTWVIEFFSRDAMKDQTRLPWNLIPQLVFGCKKLPRTPGTGKIDRSIVKRILQNSSVSVKSTNEISPHCPEQILIDRPIKSSSSRLFQSLVSAVLFRNAEGFDSSRDNSSSSLPPTPPSLPSIDMRKSFIRLGGDSALAVSLLYQLRLHWDSIAGGTAAMNPAEYLTAAEILEAECLDDLLDALLCPAESKIVPVEKTYPKRLKRKHLGAGGTGAPATTFVPPAHATIWDHSHVSVDFAACVDATPVLLKNDNRKSVIIGACQGGVLQKLHCTPAADGSPLSVKIAACHPLVWRWRISQDLVFISDDDDVGSTIVCANHQEATNCNRKSSLFPGAMVLSLDVNLQGVQWKQQFSPGTSITTPPIYHRDQLWVTLCSLMQDDDSGCGRCDSSENEPSAIYEVVVLDISNGNEVAPRIRMPVRVVAKPLMIQWGKQYGNIGVSSQQTASPYPVLVYASADWKTGVLVLNMNDACWVKSTRTETDNDGDASILWFADRIGPVHKDLVLFPHVETNLAKTKSSFLMAIVDTWGSIHVVKVANMSCKSTKVCQNPLSSPAVIPVTANDDRSSAHDQAPVLVVGSYDGHAYAVDSDTMALRWHVPVGAAVYATPLGLLMPSHVTTVLICTTAGDVVQLRANNGEVVSRYRIDVGAEIWSNPQVLPMNGSRNNLATARNDESPEHTWPIVVAFGARDSRLHFVKIGHHQPTSTMPQVQTVK